MNDRGMDYRSAGVDDVGEESGLKGLAERVRRTFSFAGGPGEPGAVRLDLGYYANVIEIAPNLGMAISTDGVGTKLLVAEMLEVYDTVGIDCIAMNVNDILCVGARPITMVDYIAVERADDHVLTAIGFDIVGTAVGLVPLDRIIVGAGLSDGDLVLGLDSSGIHSNGLTLARRALFESAGYRPDQHVDDLGRSVGEELLEPTRIYVRPVLALLEAVDAVKALIHITGDGFLNLLRAESDVGFEITDLPEPPVIFELIREAGRVDEGEMFRVFNMGVGFAVVVAEEVADRALETLQAAGAPDARVIGRVTSTEAGSVRIPSRGLAGRRKEGFARVG
jgi:phosphoribosylformylglycinamidine cyclo-ligase